MNRSLPFQSFAALLCLLACGDDGATGGTGAGGDPTSATTSASVTGTGAGGAMSCGPAPGRPSTEACKACTFQHCCDQSSACAADPTCNAFQSCVETCGDDDACWEANCFPINMGAPSPLALELDLCQLESCDAECNPGLPCTGITLPGGPECEQCNEAQCCDELDASYGPDLLRFELCQLACLDFACMRECELTYPSVVPALEAMWACFQGPECASACANDAQCGLIGFVEGGCGECGGASSCCGLFEACSLDFDCIEYFQCEIQCATTEACLECATLWPASAAGVELAARGCLESQCQTECGVPTATCGLVDKLEPGPCVDCSRQSCCTEATACGTDPDCQGLKVCVILCEGDAACRAACEADFPAGVTLYGDLEACRTTSCDTECP